MFDNFRSQLNIYDAIHKANIKYKGKANHKGWLSILCPFHSDEHFGSCSINIDNGTISCFVCGTHHINDLLQTNINIQFNYTKQPQKEQIKHISKKLSSEKKFNFVSMPLKPDEFYYTKQRGFTKEFCETFNIVRCFSFPYKDYFAVPIIDSKKSIYECEFRKLMQYEYTQNQNITEDIKYYIDDKKVKYEPNARLKETLWNIDNLNRSLPLYVCEGIGSIPKLWQFISKNCTCTFGSQITLDQIEYLKEFPLVRYTPDFDLAGYETVNKLRLYLNNLQIIDTEFEDTDEYFISSLKDTNNIMNPEKYIAKYMIHYNIKSIF
jgi:DNA primase